MKRKKLSRLTKYPLNVLFQPLCYAIIIPVSNTVISNSPLAAPRDVLRCPVNLQIQEEDSSFSHHRQRAPGFGGGSNNSGEGSALTRQNDRTEERPDSRADLLVHSLQTRTDAHADGQTDTETHTHAQSLHCWAAV